MIHVSSKHGVVGVPYDAAVANLFPHAKEVDFNGSPYLVLPHGIDETRLLRNLSMEIPAPILSRYNWPGGSPFDVQRRTCALLTTNYRAYVLSTMGTGKTRCALWSYDFLRSIGEAKRVLIVAPLSTLNFTWAKEAFATIPHCSRVVLHGTRKKRLERLAEEHDIYIINPDGLGVIEDALKDRPDIDTVVIDELALFRNGSAARTKLMKRIVEPRKWVWGMTGSPTPNEPTDAWAQAWLITPNTVPKRFTWFRDEVMHKVSQFRYVPKRDAADRVFSALQPAVRFTLDDVAELPDIVFRTVDIEMGTKQAKVYDQMRQHAFAMVSNAEIDAVNAGVVLNKLLQISLGYIYTRDKRIVGLDNDLRIDALLDAIDSTDEKVIVFCPYTHALTGVADALKKHKIDHAVVSGATSAKVRGEIFTKFQNTNAIKVLAAHPMTASHGLTLTAATTIVWFGPITSLEVFDQANARIRRVGQTRKQQVLMFQATAAERRIYSLLRRKQNVQDSILDLFKEASA